MTQGQGHSPKRLQDIEQLLIQGKFNNALQAIESFLSSNELEENTILIGKIIKSKILSRKGDLKKGLQLAEETLAESQQMGASIVEIDAHIALAEVLEETGKIDKCLAIVKQAEKALKVILDNSKDELPYRKSCLDYRYGRIYWRKGQLDDAMEYFQQSLTSFEELGEKYYISYSLNGIGNIFGTKGDFQRGLEYYHQALKLGEEIGNKQLIATFLNNIGISYRFRGELDRALDYIRQSMALYEELESKPDIALSLINMGEIHRSFGELEETLSYLQRSLEISEEVAAHFHRAIAIGIMGMTYRQMGDFDLAIKHLEEGLALFRELGGRLYDDFLLFFLIAANIDAEYLEQAQFYLQRLEEEAQKLVDNKLIDQEYRLAEAMVLKTSLRIKDKFRAQETFQQIAEEEIIFFDFTLLAMLNLCDLLLDELKTYGEDAVFQEAQEILQNLSIMSQNERSFSLGVEILILQARFAIVEGDLTAAVGFLSQASITAEEKGLGRLNEKVALERQRLDEEFEKSQKLIKNNASYKERLEQARVEDHLKYAMKLVSLRR